MNALATLAAHSEHGGPGPAGLLFLLILLALVGAVVWLLVQRRREPSGADRAREILAERYARGDIGGDEYRERLEQLR